MNKNKNNPFRSKGGGQVEKTKKESEWGKVKFNPVAKIAATERATPWSHFKNEIIQKQQDDERESKGQIAISNAKEFLKKREENYRRTLIESKRNEPTKWEDFSEETPATSKTQKKQVQLKDLTSVTKDNFDSKTLTPGQNHFLKKVITQHTLRTKGVTFKQAVIDLKRNGVKKKSFKK